MASDAQHLSKQATADCCICTTEPKAGWYLCWHTCMVGPPPRRGIWGTQSLQVHAHRLRPPAHLPGAASGWGSPCAPVRMMPHSEALELSHSRDTRHALQCLCTGVCEGSWPYGVLQMRHATTSANYARSATQHACCCRCLAAMTRHALQYMASGMQASNESLSSQSYAGQAGSRAPRGLTRDAEASEGLEGGGGLCLRASSARCCSFNATV